MRTIPNASVTQRPHVVRSRNASNKSDENEPTPTRTTRRSRRRGGSETASEETGSNADREGPAVETPPEKEEEATEGVQKEETPAPAAEPMAVDDFTAKIDPALLAEDASAAAAGNAGTAST